MAQGTQQRSGGSSVAAVPGWSPVVVPCGGPRVAVPCGLGLGEHDKGGKGEILSICTRQATLRGQCGVPGREHRGCQEPGHLFVGSSGPPGLLRLRIRRIPLTWLQDPEGTRVGSGPGWADRDPFSSL